jgi:hypothetical protein
MFGWTETRPIGHGAGYNPADYTFEGDGHLYAFQEAFRDLAEIDGMIARMNNRGVNAYAEGYHKGGPEIAQESANAFMNSTAVTEGFLGDVKDKLVKLLTKLKEKIKAFFHSAVQYFDKWFKDEAAFAEKYEDEIDKKDLSDFKYSLYEWKMDAVDFKKAWADLQKTALEEAKKADVAILEAFMIGGNDWVGALEALYVSHKDKEYFITTSTAMKHGLPEGYVKVGNSAKDEYEKLQHLKNAGYKKMESNGGQWDDTPGLGSRVSGSESESAKDSDEEKKDSTASTVKSITSAQRKQIQRAVMKALGSDAQNPEGFKKDLKKKLQGGKSEPREINPNMSEIINGLKNYKEDLDNVKEAGDELIEGFDDEIDRIKGIESKGDEATKAKNRIAAFTEAKDMYMKLFDVYKTALKERGSQYKNCLSAALHYSPKEK